MVDVPVIPPAKLFDLAGRVAVVTGASSGLGERFARVLHAAGASVVCAARRTDRLERLVDELGEATMPVPCDVDDDRDRELLIEATVDRFGGFDVLVNNAGISSGGPAESESLQEWHKVLGVNLTAPFHLSQLSYPYLAATGHGAIINVSSMLGLVASAPVKQASYCTTKGGLVNLTRELGCQWARRGVRVNALAPGWFRSEMTSAEMLDAPESRAFIETNCPMGRPGAEHELDGALLFLASDASSYLTGHTLVVDGGWTAR